MIALPTQIEVVYVGATFSRYLEARAVMDAVMEAGARIAHDWTRTDAFGPDGHSLPETAGGYDLPPHVQAAHAQDDLEAVAEADLGLFLAQEPSLGWPIEMGAMLALARAHVWVVAPFKPTVFLHLPQVVVFGSVEEALEPLGARLPEGSPA